MQTVLFCVVGSDVAYAVARGLARLMYWLLWPLRERSEAQCRAALGDTLSDKQIEHVARESFVQRTLNLTDLKLAPRLLHPGTYVRCGGRVPEPYRSDLLDAQRRGQPAILLSAYYGPYDLLPVMLGFDGIRAGVVYAPHLNAEFDAFRRRVRQRGGWETVPVDRAVERLPQILEAGGTVAIVADHHVEQRRGIPVEFMRMPTTALRTVGLFAWRYDADVVVAGIRRLPRKAFRFEIVIADVIKHAAWQGEPDAVRYITERYMRGLESLVRLDPTQYLWAHARWGEDLARELAGHEGGGVQSDG